MLHRCLFKLFLDIYLMVTPIGQSSGSTYLPKWGNHALWPPSLVLAASPGDLQHMRTSSSPPPAPAVVITVRSSLLKPRSNVLISQKKQNKFTRHTNPNSNNNSNESKSETNGSVRGRRGDSWGIFFGLFFFSPFLGKSFLFFLL